MWCKVGKCCFCIDLRKGVITLACICLVLDALLLALMSCLSYYISEAEKDDWTVLRSEEREMYFQFMAATFWMTTAGAVISSLAVFLDILLLKGAIKAQRKVLHGWKTAYAVVFAFSLFIYGMIVAWDLAYRSTFFGLLFTACILLHAGLMLYLWIVVRSYCWELGKQYGDCGPHSTAGKVYSKAGELPEQVTYRYADSKVMPPTASPCYTVFM